VRLANLSRRVRRSLLPGSGERARARRHGGPTTRRAATRNGRLGFLLRLFSFARFSSSLLDRNILRLAAREVVQKFVRVVRADKVRLLFVFLARVAFRINRVGLRLAARGVVRRRVRVVRAERVRLLFFFRDTRVAFLLNRVGLRLAAFGVVRRRVRVVRAALGGPTSGP
jgi:hypothetical protein